MILSQQVEKALTYIQNIEVSETANPWEAGRAFYKKFIPLAGEKEAVFDISDRELLNVDHLIKLRIYRPNNDEKPPVIIYFHGGWFNAGDLETHDTPLRQLANLSKTVIIAVSYRLAPEHPFPAGLDDCVFSVKWIIKNAAILNLHPNKITIAGDSAGGALAATITRKFREVINAQLLIYPVTDNSLKTFSWKEFQNGPLLNLEGGIQAWDWYLNCSVVQKNPNAVPILANDLNGLPPTFIAVAEHDPLRDEGIFYLEKLIASGSNTKLSLYKGMIHGFFQMGGFIDDTKTLMQDMAEFIKTQNSL